MGNPRIHPQPAAIRAGIWRGPTIRESARRLLAALDQLCEGHEGAGFAGWENGNGEPAGDEVEAARHELRMLLGRPPCDGPLTDGDMDEEAFERVWRSDAVRLAGENYGWRGIAEAVWRAMHAGARGNKPTDPA